MQYFSIMRRKTPKLFYFHYICLVIFVTLLSGAISTSFSNTAIAQVSSSNEAESAQLIKAKKVTQGFFDSLIGGQYEQAREYISPSVKEYFSAADIEQQWQKVLDDMGSFVQYRKIRPTKLFDSYYVLVTANFENLISDFVVTLDSNQQITTVDFLSIGNIQANAEEFVDALGNGKYGVARGYLTPDLKKTILPENLEQRWQEIVAAAGPFKYRTSSRVVKSSSSDAVLVDLEFARENRSFLILFNPLGQIVGVDFPQSPE